MSRTTTLLGAATLGLVLGAGCNDEQLFRPTSVIPVNALFTRYVAMGNSITAGFQSAGINDSTQRQAYPVLLAGQMQTPFFQPLMNKPGCPPPLVNVFTGAVVQPPVPPLNCALREPQPLPPPFLSDVAVPGAKVIDALSNFAPTGDANALTTLFLGGMTQIQAMERANPTFVTIWIGNNDVLGAATDTANAGNPALVTRVDSFTTRYTAMLNSVDSTPSKGHGVLIGVADVGLIPYLSYGQVYLFVKSTGALPANFAVSNDCAPSALGGVGDTVLVPFRYGFGLIAAAQANPSTTYTLDCLNDHNIEPAELANLHAAVKGYNAAIAALAAARGYAYADPNPALLALRADTAQVAPFPHANPADPKFTTAPFGTAFSKDGVHPSAASHKLIANLLIQAIDAQYGTTVPAVP
ncbi:MAG TPA: SGNH/GDSL hydrolase family protein [Gemmatimonadales bacterium]|jgi:lysophospholipase L1-like esterase|nr:SGNH/GDSL hydrolase family protein [Gemmatimonadales bacterium]